LSATVYWIVLACALALASYSVRLLVQSPPPERRRRAIVLVASAGLGVLLGGWALGWDSWPAGLVAGLAVVELGPAVLRRLRREVEKPEGPS